MLETLTLYWLPHCTTCQNAEGALRAAGRAVTAYRNLKETPLARCEVEALAAQVGGVGELFSRRARKYRQWGLHERELSNDEMLDLMVREYTFIKRPVLVRGERALAGFTAKAYERFFSEG